MADMRYASTRSSVPSGLLPLAIVLLAFAIRAAGAAATGLWYDELQSVTHAALPLVDLLRSVYRWDAHPPVYYAQLHVWMLAGTSDLWVRLNPIFWSTLTTASVYVIARRLYSRQVALLAATLFAASAFAVWYAQQARMYALLMFLGLWSLYFAHRFLAGSGGWLTAAAFLLTTELFLYSQGAAFLLLASLACYAFVWRRGRWPARSTADEKQVGWIRGFSRFGGWRQKLADPERRLRTASRPERWAIFRTDRRMWAFAGLLVAATALYAPWLRHATEISVRHTMTPNLYDVTYTLFSLVFGVYEHYGDWLRWSSMAVLALGVGWLLLKHARSRPLVWAFVVAPPLCSLLISLVLKPVWLYKSLAYITPFLCITLALIVCELIPGRIQGRGSAWIRRGLVGVMIAVSTASLILQQITPMSWWDTAAAARILKAHVQPGDIVYAPGERFFWALSWYLVGPGSVNPLSTDYDLVSPAGVRIVSRPAIARYGQRQTTWLVYRADDIDAPAPFDPGRADLRWRHNYVIVERIQ
ncbi:MAG: hypothetical protein FJ011_17940 [Chloroflexi bacterium]|nr:hypothetical protein [Chloroflexota bacterium]